MSIELKEGDKAPEFSLETTAGLRRLKDFAGGHLVLYFYPKDDTPGCTVQACDFTASIADFKDLDATVLGISADSTESHRKFIAKHDLAITLLSDPDHAVMEKYGAWGEKNLYGKKSMGIIRSTVLIDPDGKVAHHWPKVQAKGHVDKVRATLTDLQAQ